MTFRAACFRPLVVNDDPRRTSAEPVPTVNVSSSGAVDHVDLGFPTRDRVGRWRRRWTFPGRALDALSRVGRTDAVTHVVVPSMFWTVGLRRVLRRHLPSATLVVDVVEQHDAAQFRRGVFDPYFLRHRFTSWYARRRADRVVVISSALAAGQLRSRSPLVLPPAVDVAEFSTCAAASRPAHSVHVTYFGSPGAKDDLGTLLRALPLLDEPDRARLAVSLAGLTEEELRGLPGVSDADVRAVGTTVECLGRLDRPGLLELLAGTHFTYLLRDPEAGFARHGFPSKVPESLAAGCPIIGNLTSDLGEYLTDGGDALVCRTPSVRDVADGLTRAIRSVDDGTYDDLSRGARATAERRFDPAVWAQPLRAWLTSG